MHQDVQAATPEESSMVILGDISDLVIKRFGEEKYGTWTIKFNSNPNKDGKYGANAFHDRNAAIKVLADTHEEAIAKAKREIDFSVKLVELSPKVKKVTLDFNVEFTRDIVDNDDATGIKFLNCDDGIFLTVTSIADPAANGFQPLKERTPLDERQGTDYTIMWCAVPSVVEFRTLGLQPHGRYAIEYERDDAEGNRVYRLVFDSVAKSSNDKVRLFRPGMTIATHMR